MAQTSFAKCPSCGRLVFQAQTGCKSNDKNRYVGRHSMPTEFLEKAYSVPLVVKDVVGRLIDQAFAAGSDLKDIQITTKVIDGNFIVEIEGVNLED